MQMKTHIPVPSRSARVKVAADLVEVLADSQLGVWDKISVLITILQGLIYRSASRTSTRQDSQLSQVRDWARPLAEWSDPNLEYLAAKLD